MTTKRPLSNLLACIALVGLAWISSTVDAHAYLDPGTGSVLLQSLAAGAFTLVFYMKVIRSKLRELSKRWLKHKDPDV
jgi:hypothetical protein